MSNKSPVGVPVKHGDKYLRRPYLRVTYGVNFIVFHHAKGLGVSWTLEPCRKMLLTDRSSKESDGASRD